MLLWSGFLDVLLVFSVGMMVLNKLLQQMILNVSTASLMGMIRMAVTIISA